MSETIDLKAEQEATLARPHRKADAFTSLLFWGMDVIHGKALTYPKIRLLELLARIPYQAWEIRQYRRLNRLHERTAAVERAEDIINWGRHAQDNEFWHLQTIAEKIREDGVRLLWFRDRFIPPVAAFTYVLFSRLVASFNIETAFKLNSDFEDHAEHEYMNFVKGHPDLENQPVKTPVASLGGRLKTWAEVFRRIGLDEREHMNESLRRCGRASEIVPYADGRPG